MKKDEYLSLPEAAKIMGISRIAVYKKVRKGQIKATRIGRAYVIPKKYLVDISGADLDRTEKKKIDAAVRKIVSEYGEVLKLLGRE